MRGLLFFFILVSARAVGQGLDTLEVSNLNPTYLLLDNEVLRMEVGNKDFVAIYKDNMVSIKATREYGLVSTLMVKTRSSVNVWILRYSKKPKSILINMQNQQPVTTQLATPVQQQPSPAPSGFGTPPRGNSVASTSPAPFAGAQGGYMSQEVYAKRNEDRYGSETPPDFIVQRTESGNRNVNTKDPMMQKKFYSILKEKRRIKDVGEISNRIYFTLEDIWVDREYMYFKISINNTSSIAFDLDFISFERAQGKTFKRKEAVSQMYLETEFYETLYSIAPSTTESVIYAVKLFALKDNDFILVKLSEIGGVRTTQFSIDAKLITSSKTL